MFWPGDDGGGDEGADHGGHGGEGGGLGELRHLAPRHLHAKVIRFG